MDLSWVVRARWRLAGAWMWPAFVVLGVADGVIGHVLPAAGDSESVLGGIVVGLVLNVIAVAVLARPAGMLLRRRRRDLPSAIARNYGGTACVVLVTIGFAALGLAHHSSIAGDRAVMRDATARAAAWIGDHAPAPFRMDASRLDTVVIQADSLYRACAANPDGTRDYCVVVNERRPPARSVIPDGSESNETLARGTD
jgi:hypothetical protein